MFKRSLAAARRASRAPNSLWGSEIRFGVTGGQSGCDVVLVGKPAGALLTADPVVGEVDRLRRLGAGLSRCELAEEAVRPGRVVVLKVFSQHLPQVVLIDDQQSAGEFLAQGADDPFADRVRLGACSGLVRILMPSAVKTASKELVN
jgi:hypothetical protein